MNTRDIDTFTGFKAEVPAEWHGFYLLTAKGILKSLKARQKAYDEEVDDWYRAGDGRRPNWRTECVRNAEGVCLYDHTVNYGGMGHRFPQCIHGTSLWTDYDNICGGCESEENIYSVALSEAHSLVVQMLREEHNRKFFTDAGFPDEAITALVGSGAGFLNCLMAGTGNHYRW